MNASYRRLDPAKRCLITGAAGFIGYHLAKKLAAHGAIVVGFDNVNDYYDVNLKYARLKSLEAFPNFTFMKGDLADADAVKALFENFRPEIVVNLAAQAGVRYSIENPRAYVDSNVVGFFNILESCRRFGVEHLVYASSSSVYGNQAKTPFEIGDPVDEPISLYPATKKSNELFAHSYSHLYGIPCTGLRFFTVYGPYGRPDMAAFIFTRKIVNDEPIQIFNNGDLYRDFTYIDDIVQGIENVLCNPPKPNAKGARVKLYNIGANQPENLLEFVKILERHIGKEAKKEMLPMQPGDVYQTYANVDDLIADFGFKPSITLEEGLKRFVDWYLEFYQVRQ